MGAGLKDSVLRALVLGAVMPLRRNRIAYPLPNIQNKYILGTALAFH